MKGLPLGLVTTEGSGHRSLRVVSCFALLYLGVALKLLPLTEENAHRVD